MIKKHKEKLEKWGIVFLVTLFSIFVFYLNHQMPFVLGDDLLYALKFPENGFIGQAKITNLQDYFESQKNHYTNYNNRIVPHALLQLILLFPNYVFDLINTAVLFIIPYVLLRPFLKTSFSRKYTFTYFTVLVFFWAFHYDLGRSYFWTTGAVNYSWFLIPQLLLLGSLYLAIYKDKKFTNKDVVLALVVSTANENVVLSLFVLMLSLVFYRFYKKTNHDKKIMASTAILLFGGIIMLLSPALHLRVINESIAFESYFYKIIEYSKRLAYYLISMTPVVLLFFAYKVDKSKRAFVLFFASTIFLSTLSMVIVPLYEPRLSIFAFSVFFMLVLSQLKMHDHFRFWPIALVFIFGISILPYRLSQINKLRNTFDINQKIIDAKKDKSFVTLKNYCHKDISTCIACDELSTNINALENRILSAYLNVDSVVLDNRQRAKSKQRFKSQCEQSNFSDSRLGEVILNTTLVDDIKLQSLRIGDHEVLFELNDSDIPSSYTYIIRGARKKSIKHKLLNILPNSIQQYFLTFLEDNPTFLRCGNKIYAHAFIKDLSEYDYLIWSLYSKSNHSAVGQMVIIDLD